MKTAICYYSEHHGNTKLLLDAICKADPEVVLIDCTKRDEVDLLEYDRIGFASGIYFGAFAKQLQTFAQINLPDKKQVFFLYTCGTMNNSYTDSIRKIAEAKEAKVLGAYCCYGFDTFGPFKIVGGIKKGHPNDEEIAGAVKRWLEDIR